VDLQYGTYLFHVTFLAPKILRWLLVLREFVHPCNYYDANDNNCSLSTLLCYFTAVTVPTFEVPSYLDEIMNWTLQDLLGRWEDVYICITVHHPDSRAQIPPPCIVGLAYTRKLVKGMWI